MEDTEEDSVVSDAYNRTLLECLPRFWPKTNQIESLYKKSTFELVVEIIFRSNWQNQLIVIQSINQILQKSSTITSQDLIPLVEPIINLGPRTKTIALKREILKFVKVLFDNPDYSKCFDENEHMRSVLHFNIDEMIHDNRSNEISEQAKELKKSKEHLFVKIQTTNENVEITPIDQNENNLF